MYIDFIIHVAGDLMRLTHLLSGTTLTIYWRYWQRY